jgi:hypothetical protein
MVISRVLPDRQTARNDGQVGKQKFRDVFRVAWLPI